MARGVAVPPTIFGSSSSSSPLLLLTTMLTADATTSTRTTLLLQFEWRPALSPRRHYLYPSPYNLNVSICLGLCSRCCQFCCICHIAGVFAAAEAARHSSTNDNLRAAAPVDPILGINIAFNAYPPPPKSVVASSISAVPCLLLQPSPSRCL